MVAEEVWGRDRGRVRPTRAGRETADQPALDALDSLLERYVVPVPQERDVAEQLLDDQRQFLRDFRERREVHLRTLLEEVAWRLEQRGHHAWLHEEDADLEPPADRDAISLSMLPIGYEAGRDEPSTLTFVAEPTTMVVLVQEHIGGTEHRDLPIGAYPLEQLDDANVAALAAELVRRSFTAYPPLATKEAEDPSIARDDDEDDDGLGGLTPSA